MTSKVRTIVVAILTAMLASPATAEELGNASRGLTYARVHCAECHAVEGSDELSPNFAAPAFSTVANTPGMTDRALAVWLVTSHPEMPNLMIPEPDRDDLIAYIMSLKVMPPQ